MPPSRSPDITPWTLSPHVADLMIDNDGRVQYRDERQRRRKVAICGAGGTHSTPWDDPSFECWAMNNFWQAARDSKGRIAASRWFEQHQIFPTSSGAHAGEAIQNDNDMAWLLQCPVPLYTTEPFPANPLATVWPIEYYAKKYRDYFTCTFAMQIVQAFDEGFEELHVHGLELHRGTKREATVEAACVAYWLGFVEGRGMRVVIPSRPATIHPILGVQEPEMPQWLLLHPYRYGHEYWEEKDWVLSYIRRWDEKLEAV